MGYPPLNYALPDPWVANYDIDYQGGAAMMAKNGPFAATAWVVANNALAVPVIFPCNATLYAMYALLATATDNYDLGFYRADFTAVARKGSTAVPAAATVTLSLPDYRVGAGELFYMVLNMDGTTSQFFRSAYTTSLGPDTYGGFSQASAFPLPDPIVPSSAGLGSSVPLFAFGVR